MPVVSLSYEHRMTGLLEKLGLTERSIDVQGIFVDESGELCRHALEQVRTLLERDVFVRKGFKKLSAVLKGRCRGKRYDKHRDGNIQRREISCRAT